MNVYYSTAFLLASLTLSIAAPANSATVELNYSYRNGLDHTTYLFDKGIKYAVEYLETEFKKRPNDEQLRIALYGGQAVGKPGQQTEYAARLIESELKVHSNNEQLRFVLGIIYWSKPEKAVLQFEEIIRRNPLHADSHFLLGILAFGQRDLDSFARHMQSAIRSNPFHVQAYNALAMVYAKTNKLDEAIQIMEEAKARIPREESIYFNQALMYVVKDQYQEVISDMTRAVAINADKESLLILGWAHFKQKEYEVARMTMRRLLEIDPKNVNALLVIATTYKETKDFDKALEIAEQARAIEPSNKTIDQEIKEYKEEYKRWKERGKM